MPETASATVIDRRSEIKPETGTPKSCPFLGTGVNFSAIGQITGPLGIAMYTQHISIQQKLIKAADQALYVVKE